MFVNKTPLRVSFFGGGTDYPEYARDHPSAVLGGTINKYIYTTASPLAPFANQKFRISYKVVEDCMSADEINHPIIREVLKYYDYDTPTGFYTVSDIPGSTGLGSSSAFTVGFYHLVNKLSGSDPTKISSDWLAKQAIHLERVILNENVGVQDQTHAAYGGFARYDFNIDDDELLIHRQAVVMPDSRRDLLNNSMILVYTDIQRHASEIVSEQIAGMKTGSSDNYLNTMYEMVGEAEKIFAHPGNDQSALSDIGALLNQSWSLKQNLGKGVTNAVINDIYNTGIELGAWGGKLLGAGGGGFVMFLLDPTQIYRFTAEFGKENIIPVKFTDTRSVVTTI